MKGIEIIINGHSSVLREVLYEVFSKVPAGLCCFSSDYEVITENAEKELPQPALPKDLAKLLTAEGTVMTCGRFFCYPLGVPDAPVATFGDFEESPCGTVILVIDSSYIEIYSKNSAYLKEVMGFLNQQNKEIVKSEYVCGENIGRTTFEI